MKTICADCLYCVPIEDSLLIEHYVCACRESDKFLKEVEPTAFCEKAVEDTDYDGEFDELWRDENAEG